MNAEEGHEALVYNSEEWKGALSAEAYFRREAALADTDLASDGGVTGWMLAVDEPSGKTRRHLSACETLRKHALVVTPAGGIQEVICYGVASVFCPHANRGKGYPTEMISQLGKWMDTQSGAAFSVLYSDIGKKFYDRHGWKPFESSHVDLPADAGEKIPEGVKFLKAGDLDALCKRDERNIRRRLEKLASQGKNAVAILPDIKTTTWQLVRESAVSKELFGESPDIHGAVVKTSSGKDVWCFWTRWWYNTDLSSPKGNTLYILRLAVDDENYDDTTATPEGVDKASGSEISNAIADLLQAARVEASKANMEDVKIWNPSSATLAAAQKLNSNAHVIHRDKDSIASLKWCDQGLANIADSLVWTCNEKFAWC
ncbi:hypothetical protein K461DRAFT_219032 [Myriangium duriaei CBS 260.36]|uniref:LYC1 C-terminal domain-containing protein n=1 Tax=Myriangium duriaei CBS 260.36 TaxID=1168546 RepID=A0A9P4MS87_9PEZI|nr:hypothetical protein K461DRAFT_219032 [Myriangium duriaei CBS 260.36]